MFVEVESKPSISKETYQKLKKFEKNVSCRYETKDTPFSIPVRKPNPKEADPKMGVSNLKFSPDSSLLASKNENMPNTVTDRDPTRNISLHSSELELRLISPSSHSISTRY